MIQHKVRMNQLFLVVLALLIILQSVVGAPDVPCDKLKDSKLSSNNIYSIILKKITPKKMLME